MENSKKFRELGAQKRRTRLKMGKFFGHDLARKGFGSYPHFFHAGFLLSAFVNLAIRQILSRGKFDLYLKKLLTFPL